MINSTVKLG